MHFTPSLWLPENADERRFVPKIGQLSIGWTGSELVFSGVLTKINFS